MKNKLLIIGASGHGKVVADIARKMNKWERIAFLDDNEYIQESLGIEVLGKSVDAFKYIKEFDLFVAIGNNDIRARIQNSLLAEGASIPLLVHPNSTIGEQVAVGKGTAIMAGVVINSSTKIGNGCIVNTAATIDHDNWIDDYVHISPGVHLAGTVKIGQKSWLGIGAAVSNNVSITSNCKIGAGAVVINNITESGNYVGVPVRRVFKNENSSIS
jgi:sugar O-acyltransferase (sialic acid O-acetyltransferase NeuD family)